MFTVLPSRMIRVRRKLPSVARSERALIASILYSTVLCSERRRRSQRREAPGRRWRRQRHGSRGRRRRRHRRRSPREGRRRTQRQHSSEWQRQHGCGRQRGPFGERGRRGCPLEPHERRRQRNDALSLLGPAGRRVVQRGRDRCTGRGDSRPVRVLRERTRHARAGACRRCPHLRVHHPPPVAVAERRHCCRGRLGQRAGPRITLALALRLARGDLVVRVHLDKATARTRSMVCEGLADFVEHLPRGVRQPTRRKHEDRQARWRGVPLSLQVENAASLTLCSNVRLARFSRKRWILRRRTSGG
jgi:hypothetical protein